MVNGHWIQLQFLYNIIKYKFRCIVVVSRPSPRKLWIHRVAGHFINAIVNPVLFDHLHSPLGNKTFRKMPVCHHVVVPGVIHTIYPGVSA